MPDISVFSRPANVFGASSLMPALGAGSQWVMVAAGTPEPAPEATKLSAVSSVQVVVDVRKAALPSCV